jgi:hypothetical protein
MADGGDLERGEAALQSGRWTEARAIFEAVLSSKSAQKQTSAWPKRCGGSERTGQASRPAYVRTGSSRAGAHCFGHTLRRVAWHCVQGQLRELRRPEWVAGARRTVGRAWRTRQAACLDLAGTRLPEPRSTSGETPHRAGSAAVCGLSASRRGPAAEASGSSHLESRKCSGCSGRGCRTRRSGPG